MTGLQRWLVRPVAWLSVALLLLLLPVFWLLATEAGFQQLSRYAAAMEPRLHLQQPSGRLLGQPAFAVVQWRQEDVQLTLRDIQLSLSPACWLSLRLCVTSLQLGQLELRLAESSDAAATVTPLQLPEVKLPFALAVDQASIEALRIQAGNQPLFSARQISVAKLHWQHTRLSFRPLRATIFEETFTAFGHIKFSKQYPLKVDLTVSSSRMEQLAPFLAEPASDHAPSELHADISGSLGQLLMDFTLQGMIAGSGSAQLAVLDSTLPFTAMLQTDNSLALQWQQQAISVGASQIEVSGTSDGLTLSAASDWQLPWFDSNTAVSVKASTDFHRIDIDAVSASNDHGRLLVDGALYLDDQRSSVLAVSVNALNPAFLTERVTGSLHVDSTVTLSQLLSAPHIAVKLTALAGELNEVTLASNGEVLWSSDQSLRFTEWQLSSHQDSIRADGVFPAQQLRWSASVADIARYYQPVSGALQASGTLAGSWLKPDLNAEVALASPRYGQWQADSMAATVVLNALGWQQSQLQLVAKAVGQQGLATPVDVELSLQARQSAQSSARVAKGGLGEALSTELVLSLQHNSDWRSRLQCAARVTVADWSMDTRCQQFSLGVNPALLSPVETQAAPVDWLHWQNDRPLRVTWQPATGHFHSEDFCIREGQSSLCLDSTAATASSQQQLTFAGAQLPLQWAELLLPGSYQLSGDWGFSASLQGSASDAWQLQGQLHSKAATVSVSVPEADDLQLPVETLHMTVNASPEQVKADFNLISTGLGAVNGNLVYQDQRLQARFLARQLDLQPLQGLFPAISLLQGELSGDLSAEYYQQALTISGDTVLSKLAVNSRALPVDLTNGTIKLRFDQSQVAIDSTLQTGVGEAVVAGNVEWGEPDWRASLSLQTTDIKLEPLPKSYAHVVADLSLEAVPGQVEIGGQISIPKARIELEKLPQNAVTVSDDTILENQSADSRALRVNATVKTLLGDDIKFRGFGLETSLTGHLQIQQSPGQLVSGNGVVNLRDGRYRAYGQDLLIEEGRMIFSGPLSNPQLFVTAVRNHTEDNVRVGVQATGSAKEPKLSLFSTPSMSEQNLLYYLLTGKGPNNSNVDQSRLAQQTAIALGLAQSNKRARDIGESVGIQDFQMGTDVGKNGDEAQFSGYITPDLYLLYGVSIFDQLSSITARYELTPDIYLEVYNSTSSAIDVFWSIVKD